MPTLRQAIERLSLFSNSENVPDVISSLQNLSVNKEMDALRKKLILLSKSKIQKESKTEESKSEEKSPSLAEAAYDVLLALAELHPLNDIDPITQDTIETKDKVFVSTGHQFSLSNLIEYHNSRSYRGSSLGENHASKWLLNPLTNQKFDSDDVRHIVAIAKEKNITINNIKFETFTEDRLLSSYTQLLSGSNMFGLFVPSSPRYHPTIADLTAAFAAIPPGVTTLHVNYSFNRSNMTAAQFATMLSAIPHGANVSVSSPTAPSSDDETEGVPEAQP